MKLLACLLSDLEIPVELLPGPENPRWQKVLAAAAYGLPTHCPEKPTAQLSQKDPSVGVMRPYNDPLEKPSTFRLSDKGKKGRP